MSHTLIDGQHASSIIKCPCLPCRQDRCRNWVKDLIDHGIPARQIYMEINQYGGRVFIYSGNEDTSCHYIHRIKECHQYNDRSLRFAKTWWSAHGRVNSSLPESTNYLRRIIFGCHYDPLG